jgi:hypothetical protein
LAKKLRDLHQGRNISYSSLKSWAFVKLLYTFFFFYSIRVGLRKSGPTLFEPRRSTAVSALTAKNRHWHAQKNRLHTSAQN